MTDKASPVGWVVQVAIPAVPTPSEADARWRGPVVLGAPSFQYFNVAIAVAAKAIDATAKHLAAAAAPTGEMSTVRGLSSHEIEALRLKAGEVKPA